MCKVSILDNFASVCVCGPNISMHVGLRTFERSKHRGYAWGQGLTDEQHSRYSPEAECGREMASNATWTETSNPDIDTLDLDWSALLLCVSFTCSKVQITHDAREKIAFFAFHTFLVVDSLFEQKSNQGQTTHLPACVYKGNVQIRIACSSCHPQLLLLLLVITTG